MIEIHPSAFVSPLADIEDSTRGSRIVVGPGSYIDAFVKIKAAGGSGNVVVCRSKDTVGGNRHVVTNRDPVADV